MDDEVIGKEELQMIKEQMTEDQGELQMTEELNRVVAVVRAATAPPLTSEEARQQAQAEGLVLRKGGNKAGYSGVGLDQRSGRSKPYQAYVRRGGKQVKLGSFATAEEAALCVARSPDGRATAERAAAAAVNMTCLIIASGHVHGTDNGGGAR